MQLGSVPNSDDILARQCALRNNNVRCVGEIWVSGYGLTALWEGPELDQDEQNLLNLKALS